MKVVHLLIIPSILLLVAGCREDVTSNQESNSVGDRPQLDSLTPTVRPLPETLTPSIRPIPDTSTPTLSPSYIIQSESISNIETTDRAYTDAFTLENINVGYNIDSNNFTLNNGTPRYLYNPVISVDGLLYLLEVSLEPFQSATFVLPANLDAVNVKNVTFIDRQPFFKYKMTEYRTNDDNDMFGMPSKDNAFQYEQEMRSYKNALNDFEFNVHFAEYITSYDLRRHALHFNHEDCGHVQHVKTGKDSSGANTKIVSMLTHQPESAHMMLEHSYNGYATIGSGWVSVRDFRLYQDGQTLPRTTYLHEKMHNHGFNHDGGMTYGLPDVLINYMEDEGQFPDYYDGEKLASEISKVTVTKELVSSEGYLDINFHFFGYSGDLPSELKKLMIVFSDDQEVESVEITISGVTTILTPTTHYLDGKISIYREVSIPVVNFKNQITEQNAYLTVRLKSPIGNSTLALLASTSDADKRWGVQANAIVEITGGNTWLKTTDSQYVKYARNNEFNDQGVIDQELVLFTPEEGMQLCIDNGYAGLGYLKTYKSTEQMDFQMEYLPYESQVGIDPDTHEAVAVDVNSSYRPSYVNYSDKGALIVCN